MTTDADTPQDSTEPTNIPGRRKIGVDSDQPWQEKDVLTQLYTIEGRTTREIADSLECTNGTISRWLNKHEIPTRENWVEGVEAAREANRVERVTLRTLPSGYEYWATKEGEDRTNHIVYVHRLLAVAEYGFEAVCDNDVHHEIPIPWANWHDNIGLLDPSEHGRLHSREYWGLQEETS